MGRAVFPPCFLSWTQAMLGVMVTSFKMTCACTFVFSAPTLSQATVDPCLLQRLLDTHKLVWLSLSWRHCFLLVLPAAHKACLCPPRVCFPNPVGVLWPNPTGFQSQIPWGFSVPLPDLQVGKFVVGPRTFLTVWEFLWYNCSAVVLLLLKSYSYYLKDTASI